MSDKPSVYIILLNWNNYHDTDGCINSLKELVYPNFEIVVVDNGSEDDSVSLLKKNHPAVTLIESETNRGFTGGNNLGIRYALSEEADLVWILNNDTTVEDEALSKMVRKIETDPELGIVGSAIFNEDRQTVQMYGGGRLNFFLARHHVNRDKVEDSELDYISGASMLIRDKLLREIGGFDERIFAFWEDVELSYRAQQSGFGIGYAPKALIYHIESASMKDISVLRRSYFAQGKVIFFKTHSFIWPISLLLFLTGSFMKLFFSGKFRELSGMIRGFLKGLTAPSEPDVWGVIPGSKRER